MQFRVIVETDPHRPPACPLQTQTGLITIHCAAKLSVQCKERNLPSITAGLYHCAFLVDWYRLRKFVVTCVYRLGLVSVYWRSVSKRRHVRCELIRHEWSLLRLSR